jgi:ribosomal protein S18 acetylase RimI-like enzyme
VVGTRHDRPLFSDALGELTELTDSHLTIVTERGPLRVPLAEVARAKRVPPRLKALPEADSGKPHRPAPADSDKLHRRAYAAEIAALELAGNEAWPAPEQDRLGDWLLRAAGGWTGRGNTALPVGDPGVPLAEAIAAVRRWYAARGLPPKINVPLPLAAPVNAALDALGWHTNPPTLVQAAPLARLLSTTGPRADLPPVRLFEAPSRAWLEVVAGRKGALPDAAIHLLTAVREVRFAEVYADTGELLAIARGTVTGAGQYFGIFLVEVVPAARRRGLARQVIGALAGWAGQLGATTAFLQVEEHNRVALALYQRLGFTAHHRYLTRTAPPLLVDHEVSGDKPGISPLTS